MKQASSKHCKIYGPLSTQSNHLLEARQVLEIEAQALKEMARDLGEEFNLLIEKIVRIEGRVILVGIGKSGHVARKIAATLASTGQPSFFVHPAEASHGDMGMITPQDLVIALSNSGETKELWPLIEYTRRFSIPLIALTRKEESTLSKVADLSLVIPSSPEACPMGLAPTTSTTMMMAFGDAIAVSLLKARGFSPADFKVYHPGGSLGGRLHRVEEKMHTGDALPLVSLQTPMSQVILEMSAKSFGAVGVINPHKQLCGIITDGDLRRHMGEELLSLNAEEVMTKSPLVISAKMLMSEALALINQRKVTLLFVVDEGESPIGIIHIHDFLRTGTI